MSSAQKVRWSSRFTFLMAAVGSAVGLANIWRFPYTAGVSGGGAFVLVYLGAVVLLALPLVIPGVAAARHYSGTSLGATDWFPITQERIDAFAAGTGDDQWIHTDPERARRESPFGMTIAHGFLSDQHFFHQLRLYKRAFFQ